MLTTYNYECLLYHVPVVCVPITWPAIPSLYACYTLNKTDNLLWMLTISYGHMFPLDFVHSPVNNPYACEVLT